MEFAARFGRPLPTVHANHANGRSHKPAAGPAGNCPWSKQGNSINHLQPTLPPPPKKKNEKQRKKHPPPKQIGNNNSCKTTNAAAPTRFCATDLGHPSMHALQGGRDTGAWGRNPGIRPNACEGYGHGSFETPIGKDAYGEIRFGISSLKLRKEPWTYREMIHPQLASEKMETQNKVR